MGVLDRIKGILRSQNVSSERIPTADDRSTPLSTGQDTKVSIRIMPPVQAIRLNRVQFPAEVEVYDSIMRLKTGQELEGIWREYESESITTPLDFDRVDLLRNAVRISDKSDLLHQVMGVIQRILDAQFPYELYKRASSDINAECRWSRNGLLLSFHGSVLRDFTPRELLFVTGHEVGHYLSNKQKFGAWLANHLKFFE